MPPPGANPGTNAGAGPSGPGPGASGSADAGLLERLRRTIQAGRRLVEAHVALAKAELDAIRGEAMGIAAALAGAIGLLLFVGLLLPIGLVLFVGEALFGSLGWGVLHGTELGLGLALALVLSALKIPGRGAGTALLAGIVVGTAVALLLGSGIVADAWTTLGDRLLPGVVPEWRTLATAAIGGALVVGILLALAGIRSGAGGFLRGLIGGGILGALIGILTTLRLDWRPAAGIGVAIALGIWPLLSAAALRRFDPESLKARFIPTATIETAQETFEWLKRIRG